MLAAVLEKIGEPLTLAEVDLPTHRGSEGRIVKLERGQVFVRVVCSGICGSQLQEIDGFKGDSAHLPHLLGHEGCGIVEGVGAGVRHVKKGDKVVMHWRKGTGTDAELPIYHFNCFGSPAPAFEIKAGPITTFSEFAIVSANRVTAIPEEIPNHLAALLGCALSTALATVENEAKIRFGESVLIIGCGGVGLSMILAARLAQAHPVVACDKIESKWELVNDLGADFRAFQPYIRDRFDVIIDTVGNCSCVDQLLPGGRYVVVGQKPKAVYLGSLRPTEGGGFNPALDIPRYVNLWRSGALDDYKKIITHRLLLRDINEGIQLMREGQAGRVMIEFSK